MLAAITVGPVDAEQKCVQVKARVGVPELQSLCLRAGTWERSCGMML